MVKFNLERIKRKKNEKNTDLALTYCHVSIIIASFRKSQKNYEMK
jgi:hypothetical protein